MADAVVAIVALGTATGLALWGVWVGYHERRKRLILEKRLADAAADHARRESMRTFAESDATVREVDRKALEGVSRATKSGSLAEYLRSKSTK